MKVLLSVAAFLPYSYGGGEIYVHRLARTLRARGHDAEVFTAVPETRRGAPEAPETYEVDGIPVHTFRPEPTDWRERHAGHGPGTIAAIARIVERVRPTLVHANGWKPSTVEACRNLGVPYVTTVHHAGVVCPAGTLVTPNGEICGRAMAARACVPCANRCRRPRWGVGHILGSLPAAVYRRLGARLYASPRLSWTGRGLIHPWLVEQAIEIKRALLSGGSPLIAPSEYVRDLLVRNGCDPSQVVKVPHGVEPLPRTPLPSLTDRRVRLGYVGRIERHKGLHVLLSALEHVQGGEGCELHVYGAPKNVWDHEYVRSSLARYRGRHDVKLHGKIGPGELATAYSSFDVLVVPSLLPEAFGLVVLEAYSAGRPVVVFGSGALPELVRDGIDGIVVRRGDVPGLAAALQRLVADPTIVAGMAARLPAVMDMDSHATALLPVYERVIEADAKRRTDGADS